MKKIIFLSGAITGVDNYWGTFERADDDLTSRGYTVLNPALLPEGMQAKNYTDICWVMLANADAVLMLPGWEDSMGAVAEHRLADLLDKPVYYDIDTLCEEVHA